MVVELFTGPGAKGTGGEGTVGGRYEGIGTSHRAPSHYWGGTGNGREREESRRETETKILRIHLKKKILNMTLNVILKLNIFLFPILSPPLPGGCVNALKRKIEGLTDTAAPLYSHQVKATSLPAGPAISPHLVYL